MSCSTRRPTHVPAVPRIYEKMQGAVTGEISRKPALQRGLFEWAVRCGARARRALRERRQPDLLTDVQYRLADRLVLAKVRRLFGPELQVALVGAAPIAPDLLEFFDACGVLVLEGYGLTESCAAATLNTVDAVRFGTVGKPLPGAQVAIADDGEILIGGPHVFKGYYRDPAATEEVLTADGWLRTGDLGALSPEGFLSITGRKKDLIITSSGKNIAPVNIESELRESRYVTEAVVYGDNRPYLVAMVTLDRDESVKLAERFGIATDPVTIAADPRVHAEVQKDVDRVNRKFARIEQVKRFAILGHDLTQADGELTPTMKVKRAIVYDKYCDVFTELYDPAARRAMNTPAGRERLRAFPYPIGTFLTTTPVGSGARFAFMTSHLHLASSDGDRTERDCRSRSYWRTTTRCSGEPCAACSTSRRP